MTMNRQPGMLVSVKQPEKIELTPWPKLPGIRPWLQNTYQAWRVLTSGGDHAEEYISKAEEAAKGSEDDYQAALAALRCDCEHYMVAEEKFALEIMRRLPDWMQRDLAIVRERRRKEKLPALGGRH